MVGTAQNSILQISPPHNPVWKIGSAQFGHFRVCVVRVQDLLLKSTNSKSSSYCWKMSGKL